jgi:hypothetical protein
MVHRRQQQVPLFRTLTPIGELTAGFAQQGMSPGYPTVPCRRPHAGPVPFAGRKRLHGCPVREGSRDAAASQYCQGGPGNTIQTVCTTVSAMLILPPPETHDASLEGTAAVMRGQDDCYQRSRTHQRNGAARLTRLAMQISMNYLLKASIRHVRPVSASTAHVLLPITRSSSWPTLPRVRIPR